MTSVQSQPVAHGSLPSLTGMRWAAAAAVFGFHIYTLGFFGPGRGALIVETAFSPGAVGVSFFFILSGFVLMWSSRPGENPLRFWRRRLARIYPLHVVTAFIALVLAAWIGVGYLPSTHALITNLLLIHSWWLDFAHYQSVNSVSWSLACEALFYLSFPLLAWFFRKLNAQVTAAVTAISLLAVVVIAYNYWKTGMQPQIYFYPPARLPEFIVGIGLARMVMLDRWRGPGMQAALGVTLIGYFMARALPVASLNTCCTILGFALLIPAAAKADIQGTESFWRYPFMIRLGELSFAFYMIHLLVIETTRVLFPQWVSLGILRGIFVSVAMFTVSLGLSWLLYEFVEKPARTLIAGRAKKKPAVSKESPVDPLQPVTELETETSAYLEADKASATTS